MIKMKMEEKRKVFYEPPCVSVCGVALEGGIAAEVSVTGQLEDWEINPDPVGSLPGDGGDIYLF